jgi:HlyD family secretion protein
MQLNPPLSGTGARRRARSRLSNPWLLVPIILVIAVALALWQFLARSAPAPLATGRVTQGTLLISVTGSGTVQAARAVDLSVQQAGQVKSVNVKVGDHVRAGDVLAQVDATDLELQVQQAQVNLDAAKAKLTQTQEGTATQSDIAQAQANLEAARAKAEQVRTGTATRADIASAQAALKAAQAKLDALRNPAQPDLDAAQSKVTQAQVSLQSTRNSASQAKTNAQIALQNTVNSLTQAQSKYATAKQNWEYVQGTGNDPNQPSTTGANGQKVDNKLNDAQRQQYYDAYIQADAALKNAENQVQQSQVAFDTAREQEVTQVQQAEAAVQDAQRTLDALKNPSNSDLVQAQAAVTQAQASLTKLTQGGTAADVAQANASVVQAQAALDKLTAPASQADLAQAQASVSQAEVALAVARRNLEQATLTAPFDADVATVAIVPGGTASGTTPAISLIDRSVLRIDMSLSESDSARVAVGQPVELTFDALPDVTLQGKIATIAPAATVQQNVVTYPVQVEFDPGQAPIKVGMSATATVTIQQIANAILVPSRAVQTQGGASVVQVVSGPNRISVPVQIETGPSANGQVAILACVDTGSQCLRPGDEVVLPAVATRTTQAGGFGPGGGFGGGGGRGPVGPGR